MQGFTPPLPPKDLKEGDWKDFESLRMLFWTLAMCLYLLRKNQNWESFFSVSKNIHNDGVLRQRGKSGEFTDLLQDDLRNTQYIVYIILCMKGNECPFAKKKKKNL